MENKIPNKEMYNLIFPLYMEWVNQVCEDNEEKSHFTPEEIVDKVCQLINQNFNVYRNTRSNSC